LGLAPRRPGEFKASYIDRLKQKNIIDSKVATFFLSTDNEASKVILGDPSKDLSL